MIGKLLLNCYNRKIINIFLEAWIVAGKSLPRFYIWFHCVLYPRADIYVVLLKHKTPTRGDCTIKISTSVSWFISYRMQARASIMLIWLSLRDAARLASLVSEANLISTHRYFVQINKTRITPVKLRNSLYTTKCGTAIKTNLLSGLPKFNLS